MTEEDKLVKCYLCHKSLLQERIVEGKVIKMFHPERTQTEFYLNNGSRMPVSVCLSCKDLALDNPIIHKKIMGNVIEAWQEEQNILLKRGQITKEQADISMAYHRSLAILFKSEHLDDYQIKARAAK